MFPDLSLSHQDALGSYVLNVIFSRLMLVQSQQNKCNPFPNTTKDQLLTESLMLGTLG